MRHVVKFNFTIKVKMHDVYDFVYYLSCTSYDIFKNLINFKNLTWPLKLHVMLALSIVIKA